MPPLQAYHLDRKIGRAIVGANFQIPTVNSRVYYFPQGHIEHASSPLQYLNPLIIYRPIIPCHVSALEYLADPITDEVYVKISLVPVLPDDDDNNNGSHHDPFALVAPDDETVSPFSIKVLTPSDANNGGGFSVPRKCADTIFPPLNFAVERPFQTLQVTDVLGKICKFRHIYRGTPKRHLLTTGWSKFVNDKKLIAGDSVVFMKDSAGTMFIGIRRAFRTPKLIVIDSSMWNKPEGEHQQERVKEGVFSRNGKGRLKAKEVSDAIELAVQNKPFEVVYYPRLGWSNFVVKAEAVEKAWNVAWTSGMRVKMPMETDDSSRTVWYEGTVTSTAAPDNELWQGSPWRKFQVMWDEPKVMQIAKRVSPWEVEPVTSPIPHAPVFPPPAKRFRDAQYFGVATDGQEDPFFSISDLGNSTMGHFNQSLLNYNIVPAGMQGARQDLSSVTSLSNFEIGNPHLYIGNIFGNMVPKMRTLTSTEPNVDSCQSNSLSLESRSSLHGPGIEVAGTRGCNLTRECNLTRPSGNSIRLFGKVIQVEQPVESGCTTDEGNNGCKETEGVDQ